MITTYQKDGHLFCKFDSFIELAEHIRDNNTQKSDYAAWLYNSMGGSFIGRYDLHNWRDVIESLNKPWLEGLQIVEDMQNDLRRELPEPESIARRRMLSDVDGELDVDRVMQGEEEYMHIRKRIRTRVISKNITVLVNPNASANISSRDIFWRGAAITAIVDLLEQAGYSCEVWMWSESGRTHGYNHNTYCCSRYKDCGEPLDKDRLVTGLSGWFFRFLLLGVITTKGGWDSGLGSPNSRSKTMDDFLDLGPNTVVLDMPRVFDRDAAIAAAKKLLKQATEDV